MKCQGELDVVSCAPPSYRGPAGWLCDRCWARMVSAADKVRDKIRRRRARDTES